jgi:glycosyltransferase involved in cell wall biosynthesis
MDSSTFSGQHAGPFEVVGATSIATEQLMSEAASLLAQVDDTTKTPCEHDDYSDCEAFSLVIPIYNEEDGVSQTLEKVDRRLSKLAVEYEILVVDDGSTDRTAEILQSCSFIRVIRHPRNRGYGAALKTGIRNAKHSLVVITDGDGSYENDRIPDLVRLAKSSDMVVGARTGAHVEYSFVRSIPKWFLKHFAQWLSQHSIPDLNSGLRVLRKDVVDRFLNILPNTFSFTTTITLAMLTNGYRVYYEPIDYRQRLGKSKIQPIRDTLRFTQLILRTGMYFAPLRVFLPVSGLFFGGFLGSLAMDLFVRHDLTEATLVLLVSATQLGMFALLADMIDKRTGA